MDAYESFLSGDNDATMDASIGIANYENNRMSDDRHLLVELRFDYKSTKNLKPENIRQKVSHTKALLSGSRIHNEFFFLFTEEVAPKARSYFYRLSKQYHDAVYWKAMSVTDFFGCVYDKRSFPYKPINDLGKIEEELNNKYLAGEVTGLISLTEYWMGEIEKYNLRYNKLESRAIARVLRDFWNRVPAFDDSFENEYIALLKESWKPYLLGAG